MWQADNFSRLSENRRPFPFACAIALAVGFVLLLVLMLLVGPADVGFYAYPYLGNHLGKIGSQSLIVSLIVAPLGWIVRTEFVRLFGIRHWYDALLWIFLVPIVFSIPVASLYTSYITSSNYLARYALTEKSIVVVGKPHRRLWKKGWWCNRSFVGRLEGYNAAKTICLDRYVTNNPDAMDATWGDILGLLGFETPYGFVISKIHVDKDAAT